MRCDPRKCDGEKVASVGQVGWTGQWAPRLLVVRMRRLHLRHQRPIHAADHRVGGSGHERRVGVAAWVENALGCMAIQLILFALGVSILLAEVHVPCVARYIGFREVSTTRNPPCLFPQAFGHA